MSPSVSDGLRELVKTGLARTARDSGSRRPASGASLLIYHRIGGGTRDELDLAIGRFVHQLDILANHNVVALDDAVNALEAGDDGARVVLTFDDGFEEVHRHAWPHLRERHLPFTIYLATAYVDRPLRWPGGNGAPGARGLAWEQLEEMLASGLCTVGNHTHTHVPPEALTADELDACTQALEAALGVTPQHFAYPWGLDAPQARTAIRKRFRSAALGAPGRNHPGDDLHGLLRIPVRRTDPAGFFEAKLVGDLAPELRYARLVAAAKRAGAQA